MLDSRGRAFVGIAFATGHGFLISLLYVLFKALSGQSSVAVFMFSCFLIAAVHLPFFRSMVFASSLNPLVMIRGCCLGIAQILFFEAMNAGDVTTAIVASAVGSLVAVFLGAVVLKERLNGLGFVALALAIVGSFINPDLFHMTLLGVVSGFVQGAGSILTRMTVKRTPLKTGEMVAGTVLVSGVVIATYLAFTGRNGMLNSPPLRSVAFFSGLLLLVQYSLFTMYRWIDTQRAAALTLSRIPGAMIFEALILAKFPGPFNYISSSVIIVASLLMIRARANELAEVPKEAVPTSNSRTRLIG